MVQEGLVVCSHDVLAGKVQCHIRTLFVEPSLSKLKILLEQRLPELFPLAFAQFSIGKARASIALCLGIVLRVIVSHLSWQAVVAHNA
ncbi:hypothetical protein OZ10_12920 [Xanthomonas cannabis pv. cannabis]|nr:hypothetical protein OZ10_12920 [Xanthomonas cannabis pv. cannabis]